LILSLTFASMGYAGQRFGTWRVHGVKAEAAHRSTRQFQGQSGGKVGVKIAVGSNGGRSTVKMSVGVTVAIGADVTAGNDSVAVGAASSGIKYPNDITTATATVAVSRLSLHRSTT
jgi:hypothetical protein